MVGRVDSAILLWEIESIVVRLRVTGGDSKGSDPFWCRLWVCSCQWQVLSRQQDLVAEEIGWCSSSSFIGICCLLQFRFFKVFSGSLPFKVYALDPF